MSIEIRADVQIGPRTLPARLHPTPDGFTGVATFAAERGTFTPGPDTPITVRDSAGREAIGRTVGRVVPDPESPAGVQLWRVNFTVDG